MGWKKLLNHSLLVVIEFTLVTSAEQDILACLCHLIMVFIVGYSVSIIILNFSL
jgi:hypothetical protein